MTMKRMLHTPNTLCETATLGSLVSLSPYLRYQNERLYHSRMRGPLWLTGIMACDAGTWAHPSNRHLTLVVRDRRGLAQSQDYRAAAT